MKKDWRKLLASPIHADEVRRLSGEMTVDELEILMRDADKRVSENATWVMTHKPRAANRWLEARRDALIDEAMRTLSVTKRRLTLALISRLRFAEGDVRADFLDFCMQRIASSKEPPGVRSLCMKLAFEQCRHFDDLLDELQMVLHTTEEWATEAGSPRGVDACRRNVLAKIRKQKTSNQS